jgi:biopolymer transport protein ExbB/TolQ
MSVWTWVLIGLCALSVLLVLASIVPVVRLALRLRARVNNLKNARVLASAESLQLQAKRLQRIAGEAAPLADRARDALTRIRATADEADYPVMRDALESTGAEIDALIQTLR